jgi:hypothetical protein
MVAVVVVVGSRGSDGGQWGPWMTADLLGAEC